MVDPSRVFSGLVLEAGAWLRSAASRPILIALMLLAGLVQSLPAYAGYSAIVIDTNGRVLDEVNADQLNHPASLTKMMTLYLAFTALRDGRLHMNQLLPVSAWAAGKSPTKLDLRPGQSVAVRDCVLGMITKSANDAATVMGEALGGNEDNFARLMTETAHRLGMISTVFKNASGLPDMEQVTTARDLVRLAQALYKDFPQYYPLFASREFLFRGQLVRGHNHLMERYPGMDGLKTGFTTASGFNLASSAVRGGQRLFGVVMGGQSAWARDNLMARLLDDNFAGRQTDPILVARAAGVGGVTARRFLAALSPIGEAEAATLQPAAPAMARSERGEAASPAWAIQMGSYARRATAVHAAQSAVHLAHLSGKPVSILGPARRGARHYRVRFLGFTEQDAQAACRALRGTGQSCAILATSRAKA